MEKKITCENTFFMKLIRGGYENVHLLESDCDVRKSSSIYWKEIQGNQSAVAEKFGFAALVLSKVIVLVIQYGLDGLFSRNPGSLLQIRYLDIITFVCISTFYKLYLRRFENYIQYFKK